MAQKSLMGAVFLCLSVTAESNASNRPDALFSRPISWEQTLIIPILMLVRRSTAPRGRIKHSYDLAMLPADKRVLQPQLLALLRLSLL